MNVAVVRALVAAGATPEMILAAVEADAASAETRKAKAREKKRAQRAGQSAMSTTVPGTNRDSEGQIGTDGDIEGQSGTVGDTPSPKEIPHTPLEITPSLVEVPSEKEATFPNTAPSQNSGAVPVLRLVEATVAAPPPAALVLDADEDSPTDEIPAAFDRRAYPAWFEEIWAEYKPIASKNATKADAFRAAQRLSTADRKDLLIGVVRYAVWLHEERLKRPDTPAKHLATFIHKRGWEPFLEVEDADRVAG